MVTTHEKAGPVPPPTARMERTIRALECSREQAAKVVNLIDDEIERSEALPEEERP